MRCFYLICLSLFGVLGVLTAQAIFIDVSSTHPNYESINYVQGKKIVKGYNDGSYKPQNSINRAELTKIIMTTTNEAQIIESCNVYNTALSDVPADAWFAPYVCTAKAKGVIKGYGDGTFKPAQNVKFVEAAKIISLGFGQNLAEDSQVWYRPFVTYLSNQKAIPASITDVAQNITRGEMAEIIYRLHAAVQNRPANSFTDGELIPITEDFEPTPLEEIPADTTDPAAKTSSPTTQAPASTTATTKPKPQTGPSAPTSTDSHAAQTTRPNQPPQNPMVCKSCPASTIGQPSNNCACETAYIYESTYPIAQCATIKFTCGEGYEYFSDSQQCGCKIKADIAEYWLATDQSFKLNALDTHPPIVHGTYQALSVEGLQAALGQKNIILFFHEDWCPSCVKTDQEIQDRITQLPEDAVIFKTNYDTETKLKNKFEITAPHSIVIIDKNNALQFKQTGFNFDDIVSVLEKMKAESAGE